jgi:hypothetical protein
MHLGRMPLIAGPILPRPVCSSSEPFPAELPMAGQISPDHWAGLPDIPAFRAITPSTSRESYSVNWLGSVRTISGFLW